MNQYQKINLAVFGIIFPTVLILSYYDLTREDTTIFWTPDKIFGLFLVCLYLVIVIFLEYHQRKYDTTTK